MSRKQKRRKRKRKRSPQTRQQKRLSALVNIIIPVHGRFDLLHKCLVSIPEALGNVSYRIIIVDNASPEVDKTDIFYSELRSDRNIVIVRNKENLGFPTACNIGARRGYSPLLFFLNSDVILMSSSVDTLVREMDDPEIGVCGMKLMFPVDSTHPQRPAGKIQHVGLMTNIKGDFVHAYIGWSADHPKPNSVRDMYAVTGAALMTRRAIWNKVGGFWEGYGIGTYEDVDFCLSVKEMGYNVIVNTQAEGTHFTGATVEKYQIPYPMDVNKMKFLQRWGAKLLYTEMNLP